MSERPEAEAKPATAREVLVEAIEKVKMADAQAMIDGGQAATWNNPEKMRAMRSASLRINCSIYELEAALTMIENPEDPTKWQM